MPARRSSFSVAGIGAVSMITGSSPASAIAATRARGAAPSRRDRLVGDQHRGGAVGDLARRSGREQPLVGERLRDRGELASARMPSSAANFSLVPSSSVTSTGTISRAKRPSRVARAALSWLASPKRSRSSRENPQRSAIISAPANWLNFAPG